MIVKTMCDIFIINNIIYFKKLSFWVLFSSFNYWPNQIYLLYLTIFLVFRQKGNGISVLYICKPFVISEKNKNKYEGIPLKFWNN